MLGRTNDEWEPIVVVALSADDEAALQLVDAALPGSGSVAIVRDVSAAAERIVLHSEQKAEWVRLGLVFTPHLLTPEAGADLAELLARRAREVGDGGPPVRGAEDERAQRVEAEGPVTRRDEVLAYSVVDGGIEPAGNPWDLA